MKTHAYNRSASSPSFAWRTPLTDRLGIELPFVSAGMGFAALAELAAAVSNAGGLGLLGAAPLPPDAVRALIQRTRELTDRSVGVDLIVEETAFGPCTVEAHIDVCIEERVPVVVFFWHLPPLSWIARLRDAGAEVWMQVGTPEAAAAAVAAGVDLVVAQGSEAGGHNRSLTGTFSLLPAIVDAVSPVPVLAAGGVADGRGVAGAFALGAAGVLVGTRLVASREAHAHAEYKRRIAAAGVTDVARTSIFGPEWPDQPMNVLRNGVVDRFRGHDDRTPSPSTPPRTIGRSRLMGQVYDMPECCSLPPGPETEGDFEEMCLPAGCGAGLIHDVLPAGEIVEQMMAEAAFLLTDRLPGLVRHVRPDSSLLRL